MDEFKPFLYGLMRTDVPQMNPGKGMAQAMHLQNVANKVCLSPTGPSGVVRAYQLWMEEASQKCFGTTIVLEADEYQYGKLARELYFKETLADTKDYTGEIIDDEYPMVNAYGEPFTKEMVTGYFIFAYCKEVQDIVRDSGIKLHR